MEEFEKYITDRKRNLNLALEKIEDKNLIAFLKGELMILDSIEDFMKELGGK